MKRFKGVSAEQEAKTPVDGGSPLAHPGAAFRDPIALATGWSPLGGDTVVTNPRPLIERAGGSLFYKPRFIARLVRWVLVPPLVIVLVLSVVGGAFIVIENDAILSEGAFHIFLGNFFFGVFIVALLRIGRGHRAVFDLDARQFRSAAEQADLYDVRAVQLIADLKKANVKGVDINNWQINLVREDASRVHVMNYAGQARALDDAQKIARALGKPLWTAGLTIATDGG